MDIKLYSIEIERLSILQAQYNSALVARERLAFQTDTNLSIFLESDPGIVGMFEIDLVKDLGLRADDLRRIKRQILSEIEGRMTAIEAQLKTTLGGILDEQ
ncbi:hypothetical protein HCA69_02515 [Listeria grandensis]|uniref:Uncharacterized protein n=1 Tax=Listeria grandensis TaxID=1494963 RepID=A0A7X0Y2H4_9LIST|nr:hypothetical protein [Listeria grandensis]MBC1935222.1 hypothetical protein [Listeria grandensis]